LCDLSNKGVGWKVKITAASNQFKDEKEQQISSDSIGLMLPDDTLSDYEILRKNDPLLQLVCKVADNEYDSVERASQYGQ
jgi:hypothetical protein